jgi:hypothetical protein
VVQFVFTHSERPQRLPEYHEREYKNYVYCSRESEEYAFLDRADGYEKYPVDLGG